MKSDDKNLEKEIKEAKKVAKQLGYEKDVEKKISFAENVIQIGNILANARMAM